MSSRRKCDRRHIGFLTSIYRNNPNGMYLCAAIFAKNFSIVFREKLAMCCGCCHAPPASEMGHGRPIRLRDWYVRSYVNCGCTKTRGSPLRLRAKKGHLRGHAKQHHLSFPGHPTAIRSANPGRGSLRCWESGAPNSAVRPCRGACVCGIPKNATRNLLILAHLLI
jgi:hypothetical protein